MFQSIGSKAGKSVAGTYYDTNDFYNFNGLRIDKAGRISGWVASGFNANVTFAFYNAGSNIPNGSSFQLLSVGGIYVQWGTAGSYYGNFSSSGFAVAGAGQIGFTPGAASQGNDTYFTRTAAGFMSAFGPSGFASLSTAETVNHNAKLSGAI